MNYEETTATLTLDYININDDYIDDTSDDIKLDGPTVKTKKKRAKKVTCCSKTRRKIEDILEQRRYREWLGDDMNNNVQY